MHLHHHLFPPITSDNTRQAQQPRPAQSQLMVVMLKVNDSSQFVASIISIRLTVQSGKGGKCVIGWPTIDAWPNKPNSSQMSPSGRLLQYFCL